jgi:nucleoside-diphosphate-sugar epimerase
MKGTVLVGGASGGFGRRAAQAFEAAGWRVRLYRRGTDMGEAAKGADVIVNGLNPPMYHNWPVLIPAITSQVVAAAKVSGATILMPGTVYVYGDQPGPWTETTPHRSHTCKGPIRAAMEATLKAATREDVRVIVLRGGDFIDAANPKTMLNMLTLRSWAQGKLIAAGPTDVPRSYAYLPDLARAAVMLAERRASLHPYETINMPGLTFSMDDLKTRMERLTGQKLRIGQFPWWALRLAGPFYELAREMSEMRYLHRTPHSMDGGKFARLLPDFVPTPLDQVLAEHLPGLLAKPASGHFNAA